MARRLQAAVAALACGVAPVFAADAPEHAVTDKGVAGEILDIAVDHCRRGEKVEAFAMFQAIREQLDPPPAIRRVISDFEATGCNIYLSASAASLHVQAGGGWDSNVSQGISARSLVLGTGDNTIELELDASYRPRAAAFAQAAADYSFSVPRLGVNLQLAVGQRLNSGASDFDLRTVSAAASREFALPVGSLRAQLEASNIWLGSRSYQHTGSGAVQWLHDMGRGAWLATLQATAIQYVTAPVQNATVYELGALREWRLDPSHSVHVNLTLQKDDAHNQRPGGNRLGFQAEVGAVVFAQGWRLRPQLAYSYWNSDAVFAPGLIDVRRRNRLRQGYLQAERPLSEKSSLVLEWRGRWARDTVSLYKYQSHLLSATLAFRF